jgi:hypothetical protein
LSWSRAGWRKHPDRCGADSRVRHHMKARLSWRPLSTFNRRHCWTACRRKGLAFAAGTRFDAACPPQWRRSSTGRSVARGQNDRSIAHAAAVGTHCAQGNNCSSLRPDLARLPRTTKVPGRARPLFSAANRWCPY